MGLDSYIFKTTQQEAPKTMEKILNTKLKGMENAIEFNGFFILINDDINYFNEMKPDIYWRKYNHITAWFSEKILENPKGIIKNNICVISKNTLIKLRQDCKKVLEHCITASGKIVIDKKYCNKIFPYLDMGFSGNADYTEDFIEELKDAKNDIDRLLLTSNNPDVAFIFYADH